jgi:hypothetical protein
MKIAKERLGEDEKYKINSEKWVGGHTVRRSLDRSRKMYNGKKGRKSAKR